MITIDIQKQNKSVRNSGPLPLGWKIVYAGEQGDWTREERHQMNKITTLAIQPASIYIAGEIIRRIEDEEMTGLQGKVKLTIEKGKEAIKELIDFKVNMREKDNVRETLNEWKRMKEENVFWNIKSTEQLGKERYENIEERLETHNVKMECGLETKELGQDTATAVKEEIDKISKAMITTLKDCEPLWTGAAMPEIMEEKQVKIKWFQSMLDVATLEPKFYPYLRDENAKGLASLIYLKVIRQKILIIKIQKVNDHEEPLVLSYIAGNYNVLNTRETPWTWISCASYTNRCANLFELLNNLKDEHLTKFLWATKALLLSVGPAKRERHTKRRLEY